MIDTLREWESAGRRIPFGDGLSVFVRDVPATRDVGLDPMLVLHGFPSSSFDFRHVLASLCADRRIVLFDFLGFGLSSKPDVRYGLRLQADVAEAVAAATHLDRVVLLTHDMGDSVGGELLARDLEGTLAFDVSERVLSNGSIYLDMAHLTTGQQLLMSLPDARLELAEGQSADLGHGFKVGLAGTFSADHSVPAEELDDQWELMARDRGNTLLPRTIRYLEDRRAEERRFTGAIEAHPSPLGVVWGDQDPVAVHDMTGVLLEARPDATLITLDGVGHYPMVEAPERFAAAVREVVS